MSAPFNPLAATIAADPYPDYARLVRERPFARDTDLGLWVAASPRPSRRHSSIPRCASGPSPSPYRGPSWAPPQAKSSDASCA
jgi:hypothetical protein